MKAFRAWPIIIIALFGFAAFPAQADDYLQLIATITIDDDSTYITSMTPIGDFNADGYPDLAVGLFRYFPELYEAVWLYYGGPDFDVYPDLTILGEPQNQNSLCDDPTLAWTFFGRSVVGLEDYNADGYDDVAISACNYCPDLVEEGRIYIYFGSPEPDTVVDIIIDGNEPYEGLGEGLGYGDFNGDGLGDMLAISPRETSFDSRAYIHLGNNIPDGDYDWEYDFINAFIDISWYGAGFDLNDDGFDDFCIRVDDGNMLADALFLGDDPLNVDPYFEFASLVHAVDDISGDGIDDFLFKDDDHRWQLCLGGDSLDFEPDYYVGDDGAPLCTYYLAHEGVKFIMDDYLNERFILYNTGIPFDTIPYNIFEHGRPHYYKQANIGDINNDGAEDLAMKIADETPPETIEIYSIIATDIDENYDRLSKDPLILCAYPNPFNMSTTIAYTVSGQGLQPAPIRLQVFDIQGRVVKTLVDERKPMGTYRAVWDGADNQGWPVSSGVYMAKLFQWGQDAGDFPVKITLVK